jgi:hypothetical protein
VLYLEVNQILLLLMSVSVAVGVLALFAPSGGEQ